MSETSFASVYLYTQWNYPNICSKYIPDVKTECQAIYSSTSPTLNLCLEFAIKCIYLQRCTEPYALEVYARCAVLDIIAYILYR